MVLLTKRFNKIFRFSLVAALCCLIFVLSTRYIDQDLSSLEYVRYLQNYHETYSGNGNKVEPEVETPPAPAANDKIKSPSGGPVLSAQDQKRRQALQEFYKQVFKNLRQHSPTGSSSRQYDEKCQLNGDIGARANDYNSWSKLTSKNLGNCLKLSNKEKTMLKETHYDFVESLKSLVLPKGTYKGDGIVTVGGGTHLPVEVFIPPNDEGEEEFCNTLLPKYNAKCIYISDVLPEDIIENFDFKGYQFKSISIIASSFENLLLLDADNFPIKALDNIFEEEPYKSTGMVLWPDFWRRTTNPAYYEIADIAVNYKKRVRNCMDDITPPQAYTKDMKNLENVPLHDLEGTIPDVSTESGQLMIRKSRHLPTILLSLYYNVNGPTWYYPIFSQKASGEGDKETFIAAANFYGLPFYQVKSVTAVDGYHQPDNKGFRGVAMLQHDFVQDYSRYKWAKSDIENKYAGKVPQSIKQDTSYSPDAMYKTYFEPEDLKEVDIMFVHSNLPKFDPYTLWSDKDLIVDGKHIRSYTNLRRLNNYDLELENFKVFKEYLCVSRTKFKYLDDSLQGDERQWKSMCGYIKERLNFLDQTHSDAINAS